MAKPLWTIEKQRAALLLRKHGWTYEELGKAFEVHHTTVCRWLSIPLEEVEPKLQKMLETHEKAIQKAHDKQRIKQEVIDRIRDYRNAGYSLSRIARCLKINHNTAQKYCAKIKAEKMMDFSNN